MHKVGLFWFHNDLRIADHPALVQAASQVDRLLCIYCLPNSTSDHKTPSGLSPARLQFLQETLTDLDASLQDRNQGLEVYYEPPLETIAQLITQYNISHIFASVSPDYYFNRQWSILKQRYAMIDFKQTESGFLLDANQLPFERQELPDSFSKFRRRAEPIAVQQT